MTVRHSVVSSLLPAAALLLAATAHADGPEVYRGRWSYHGMRDGIRLDGGGPLKIRVQPGGNTFTCVYHGQVTASGTTQQGKASVTASGGVTVRGLSCSGTIEGGKLVGTLQVQVDTAVTIAAQLPAAKDDAEPPPPTHKRVATSREETSTISGTVGDGVITGNLADDDGERMPYTVRRDAAEAGSDEGAPPPSPEPESDAALDAERLRKQLAAAKDAEAKQKLIDKQMKAKKKRAKERAAAAAAAMEPAVDDRQTRALQDDAAQVDAAGKGGGADALDKLQKSRDQAWEKVTGSDNAPGIPGKGRAAEQQQKGAATLKEAKQVKDKFDAIDKQVESGALTGKRGTLLKVGTLMGKAVSKIVGLLPVIGGGGGEVTDKAFEAGMKAGEVLGRHATEAECCTEDPGADCCGQ